MFRSGKGVYHRHIEQMSQEIKHAIAKMAEEDWKHKGIAISL